MKSLLAATALAACLTSPARADWHVAWAPETNLERLDVAAIGTAKVSIDMAAYVLTDVAVIDALTAAASRGVKVRIYRDPSQTTVAGFVAVALERLVRAPAVVVRTKSGSALMHLKSYCVDGRLLRGGAANFSASGLKHQDNDRWETDDPEVAKRFEATFNAMWGLP